MYRWTTGFQIHFIAWGLVNLARCIYVSREKGVGPATVLLKRAVISTALATFFWAVSEKIPQAKLFSSTASKFPTSIELIDVAVDPSSLLRALRPLSVLLQTDFHFCSHLQSGPMPNPEGHAWWHVLIA